MLGKYKFAILGIIVVLILLFFREVNLRKEVSLPDKLTIAAYRGDSSLLVYLAQRKGIFEKYGIEAKIIDHESGKLAVESLMGGQTDIATASDSVFVTNSFSRRDLRVFSVVSEGKTNKLVVRNDGRIKEVDDLYGQEVALSRGTTGEYYFSRFLATHYLDFHDIKVVDLDPSGIIKAFVEGRVDAAFVWEPNIYKIKQASGEDLLIWDAQEYNYFYFLLITRQEWLNQNPELAQRVVRALIEAEGILMGNNQILIDFLKESFDYTDKYLEYCAGDHRYYIYLPQSLLLELENQAVWQIEANIAPGEQIPNYLNYIYPYALEAIDSLRVNIIR